MISKSTIKNGSRSVTYQKGQELFRQGIFLSYDVNFYEDEYGDTKREILAVAEGSYGNEYDVEITVDETTSKIEESYCDCPAFESYPGLCKHCVAALLEYLHRREEVCEKEEEAALDRLLRDLRIQKGMLTSESCQKKVTSRILKDILGRSTLRNNAVYLPECHAGQVHLEPTLIFSALGFKFRLKIGITQMYILKNIYQFVIAVRELQTVSYGKKLEFLHCMDAFDEESRTLIRFLEKTISSTELEYYKRYGVAMYQDIKEFALDEAALDEFMALYAKRRIFVEYQLGAGHEDAWFEIVRESPMQRINIRKKEDGIVLEHKMEKGVMGKEYIYYVSQPETGKIFMIERKRIEGLEEFLDYMVGQKGRDVFIGQEELPAFCRNILPGLEKNYKITKQNFLPEKYLPGNVKFQIYLDTPQNDMITCKIMGIYGEIQYNIFETDDMQKGRQVRDLQREGYAKSCIMKYFYAYDPRTGTMALQGEEDIYRFLTQGMENLKELGEVFVSEHLKKFQVIGKVKFQVGVSFSGNLLQMEIDSQQFSREQLAEILSRYEQKKKYYRLKTGEFIRMDEEGMRILSDLKENFQLTDKQWKGDRISIPRYRALYLDSRLKGEGVQVKKSKEFRQLIRDMKTIEDNDFDVPETLIRTLREYQRTGFLWMKTLCKSQFGGILADDMGLGKTLQTITFLLSEFQEAGKDKRYALIVTPASLVYNWKNEFEKFAPELTVHTVAGTVKEREQLLMNLENQAVLITSYQLLNRDQKLYKNIHFHYQIIDEAQFIKNQGNQTTRTVKDIQAEFRMALTGTPVENRLSELWSIFDYVMPGFLYKYQRFRKEVESPIIKNQDRDALDRLQKMIGPFVLRRAKKDVLKELPDKIEKCMFAQMEGEQQDIYRAHAQRLQMQLNKQTDEEFKTSKIQILAELTRLRQICCDPSLFYEKYEGPSAKLELCMELIENAVESGHKILLFSQFTTMLDRIRSELKKRNISSYLLTGQTSKEDRAVMAENFNVDDTSVFCISLKAGGTGLNLTGADVVIHYDPWWNGAVETQAADRAHRIGQQQVVTVYKLVAKNTLEERIIALQEKKRELASQVLGGESIEKASFSKEELLKLLE